MKGNQIDTTVLAIVMVGACFLLCFFFGLLVGSSL